MKGYFADVLDANDLVKLSMHVWYVTTLHFGLRAKEVLMQLRQTWNSRKTKTEKLSFCLRILTAVTVNCRA